MLMHHDQKPWVAFPNFLDLDKSQLKYTDSLIYISIRSFHNSFDNKCFPSLETIAKRAGVSKDFVISSLKRLQSSGLIKVKKSKSCTEKNNPNQYSFKEFKSFEQIPMSFFDAAADLTLHEKGMLICLRQFCNHGDLATGNSITDIAKSLGVSYKTVHAQLNNLISKGYIQEECDKWHRLTKKIAWVDSMWERIDAKLRKPNNCIIAQDNIVHPPLKISKA